MADLRDGCVELIDVQGGVKGFLSSAVRVETAFPPGMPLVFRDGARLLHLDLETLSFRELPKAWLSDSYFGYSNLPCDSDHLLAILDDRLVRLNLYTLEEEVLFP